MLRLFYSHEDVLESKNIFLEALSLNPSNSAHVGMAAFASCTDPNPVIALGTSGVCGCSIMIMHTKKYTGSLGHYAGTADPAVLLEGLETMFATLDATPQDIDTVVVMSIVASKCAVAVEGGLVKRFPYAKVHVIEAVYDSCYYLPGDGKAAFFGLAPGSLKHCGKKAVSGLAVYKFGSNGKPVPLYT